MTVRSPCERSTFSRWVYIGHFQLFLLFQQLSSDEWEKKQKKKKNEIGTDTTTQAQSGALAIAIKAEHDKEQAIVAVLVVLNYTTIAQSPCLSARHPNGRRMGSVRFPCGDCGNSDDRTISVQSPHDLRTALPRSVAESPYKKSHVARIQCKNRTENRRQINRTAFGAKVIEA